MYMNAKTCCLNGVAQTSGSLQSI